MPQLDFTQPPFDVLRVSERQSLKKHTSVRYLAADETLGAEDFHSFFVVLKGQIEQTLGEETVAVYLGADHSDHLNNNDWFDARRRPEGVAASYQPPPASGLNTPADKHTYRYRALEDTLLLQINGAAIDRIAEQNRLVRQLLSGRLPDRLKALQERQRPDFQRLNPQQLNAQEHLSAQEEVQQIMLQPVTDVALLPIHIVEAHQSLQEAATVMTQAGQKHVLIRPDHSANSPKSTTANTVALNTISSSEGNHLSPQDRFDRDLGILTDTDICRAVSEGQNPADTLCQDYASFNLRTIDSDQEIGDALLTMTRFRIHRLPVLNESGEMIGILGQSDLIAHISHHSQLISIQIEQADNLAKLATAVELIGRYIRSQQQNGVKISVVSRMVQTLNAQVFTKLWQLIVPVEVFDNTCVIVMGSEGRGEQIMRTDQDNALIIKDGFDHPNLADFANTFNQNLASLGYPLCDGNIMMANPLWRKSLREFKSQISYWFMSNDPNHAIYLSAILDSEFVCGDEALLAGVREHLQAAHRQSDPMFVRQFAKAALQFGDINLWWQRFVPKLGKSPPPQIDLKKAGIFPLVHGIRALALEQDIFVPSTKARLKALVQSRLLTQDRAETLAEALDFFMAQRLAVALITEDKHARQVDPTTLTSIERDVLKECLSVVKSFKLELRQHFKLELA